MTQAASSWHFEQEQKIASDVDVTLVQVSSRKLALRAGFAVREAWAIATALSEACSNIVKHCGHGSVRIRVAVSEREAVFVFEAQDQGPGIEDLESALADGVSEGVPIEASEQPARRRGLGCGLGAIQRLMDELEIQTAPGHGTLVRATKRRVLS
jgi:serine/threonine-protein kinase RsbT